MNAAARLVQHGALSRQLTFIYFLSRRQLFGLILTLSVLLSALGIIYVTQEKRTLYATYQQNMSEQDHLQMQYAQLLLERSTWMMQSRIQQIAESKLNMMIPDHRTVVMVRE